MRKLRGGCLCGAVSFEVDKAFDKMFFCGCDQCRQITGSAFASNLFVRADGFDWLGGTDGIVTYRVPGRDISKSFCRVCGSGVPWSIGDGSKMIVPAGSLSGEPDVSERVRIFDAEQPSWASGHGRVSAHTGPPTTIDTTRTSATSRRPMSTSVEIRPSSREGDASRKTP